MSSIPFYSSQIREALVEIISNHKHEQENGSSVGSVAAPATTMSSTSLDNNHDHNGTTTAIRGKWNGGNDSSSEDEDDNNDAGSQDDDNDDDSTTSSRSMEAIQENNEDEPSPATLSQNRHDGKGKHKNKKSKNKKSKEDKALKMGKAPSILLPFHATTKNNANTTTTAKSSATTISSSSIKALEIPNILLPFNYLRDNPNWKVSSVAHSLLSTWDQFNNTAPSSNSNADVPTILVILLQSGRFAACVFSIQSNRSSNNNNATTKMLAHKTSTRYTVRKGQGGSQSANDSSKGKAKSIGAQLRREGEKQLQNDVRSTWKEWKGLGYVQRALGVYVSCPKGMRRDYLFGGETDSSGSAALVGKDDVRLRSIPLDVGKPTMEGAAAVLTCVLNCGVRAMTEEERRTVSGLSVQDEVEDAVKTKGSVKEMGAKKAEKVEVEESVQDATTTTPEAPPLTPLHEAVLDGDLPRLLELLQLLNESEEQQHGGTAATTTTTSSSIDYDINTIGGPNNETPLHVASSSAHPNAPSLLAALLLQGHANPCAVDSRGRPPYFLASSDKLREAFRLARGTLGETHCAWDDGAKVGPALSDADVQSKKAKALEKKRRQRARQKEKKAAEKGEAEEERKRIQKEEERVKAEVDAKRMRDGLKPKTSKATNACDFCGKIVKRRSQMFERLEYVYCSTECVRRHQRELMAQAAMARLG